MGILDSIQHGLEKASQEASRYAKVQHLHTVTNDLTYQVSLQHDALLQKAMELYQAGTLPPSALTAICQQIATLQQHIQEVQGELSRLQAEDQNAANQAGVPVPTPNPVPGQPPVPPQGYQPYPGQMPPQGYQPYPGQPPVPPQGYQPYPGQMPPPPGYQPYPGQMPPQGYQPYIGQVPPQFAPPQQQQPPLVEHKETPTDPAIPVVSPNAAPQETRSSSEPPTSPGRAPVDAEDAPATPTP